MVLGSSFLFLVDPGNDLVVLGGSLGYWWFLVVLGGSWWCLVVLVFLWLLVVLGGFWWFFLVLGGSWWILVVFGTTKHHQETSITTKNR